MAADFSRMVMVMTVIDNTVSYVKDIDGLYRAIVRNKYNQVIFDQPSFPSLYHAIKFISTLELPE